jgi:hypothetical protein
MFAGGERFQAELEVQPDGNVVKYRVEIGGQVLSYATVLDLWVGDPGFGRWFSRLLAAARYPAFRWETPPVLEASLDRPFEFVLLPSPERLGAPDRMQFQDYYEPGNGDQGVVVFPNLGKDAELVVPSPLDSTADYADLANFLRNAPESQQVALWRVVGRRVLARLGEKPIWVSVAGGGVLWLHVRIDSWPKYYRYSPYRSTPA